MDPPGGLGQKRVVACYGKHPVFDSVRFHISPTQGSRLEKRRADHSGRWDRDSVPQGLGFWVVGDPELLNNIILCYIILYYIILYYIILD